MTLHIPEKKWFLLVAVAFLLAAALLLSSSLRSSNTSFLLCPSTTTSLLLPPSSSSPSSSSSSPSNRSSSTPVSTQLEYTILHYATSSITPQQSRGEILLSLPVLLARRPCNFLVFGLGHDSPMWTAFNPPPAGTTLFLEEDPKWIKSVLKDNPSLAARHVKYPTQLSQADDLLRSYRSHPTCLPGKAFVKGNKACPLALADLPEEVYGREWDVIMIDAPRGYFAEAPGRMGAIWTAAVMARGRKGEGDTDVYLHDVNRKVEKAYALEFLCKKYLVKGVGRLWHFRIPAVRHRAGDNSAKFC